MTKNIDINLEFVEYNKRTPIFRGNLKLLFSGNDCNDTLINGLGRVLANRLPMYAFPPELITINKIPSESGYINSVPFNTDYMKLRLSQFPLFDIDSNIVSLHERYWKNINYLDKNREQYPNEKNIEAHINVKNDTDNIINVTTNDMMAYVYDAENNSDQTNKKQQKSSNVQNSLVKIYDSKFPFLVIKLRPKEQFKCSMKAVLGVGIRNQIWNSCSNYWYDQETYSGKTLFCFEGNSLNEITLFDRCLKYCVEKLTLFKNEISRAYSNEKTHTKKFVVVIKNEDHTFGEMINYEFQSHNDIRKSGVIKPDGLIMEIVIDVVAYNEEKLLGALMDSFTNLINKINVIELKWNDIKKKIKK